MATYHRQLVFVVVILAASVIYAETTGIRGGTEAFREGDFERAAEAFAEAERKQGDDLRIAFNRGAALFAAGKPDEALEPLRRAATARDPEVASKSLALMGRISVDRARQSLATDPAATAPEQRKTVLDHLAAAERHYLEAETVRPNESDRLNLEQLRAWRNRITEAWERTDRAQKRSDDLSERLHWLEEWEGKLLTSVRETVKSPDSPRKFQQFYEAARDQGRLADEIGAAGDELRKILTETKPSNGVGYSAGASGGTRHPVAQEMELLKLQAETAGETLRQFQGEKGVQILEETARRINRLRMNLAPFEVIVQEAEKKQAGLCDANPARNAEVPPEELEKQSRDEQTVSDWMPLMLQRARQGLEQLKNPEITVNPDGSDNVMESENSAPSPEQTEAMRKSMELAVRHGPEIENLTAEAADLLRENRSAEALPKQDRALELLREILEPLRQQQQQNDQQNDQQNSSQQDQQQPSENSEENSQDQEKQDGQQKPEPQEQKEENEPRDSDRSEQEKREEEKKKEAESKEPNEEKEKAERMLRQVKRKQQEANEKREKIRALLLQLEPVEKDW